MHLKDIFDPVNKLNLNICRITIVQTVWGLDYYSLNEFQDLKSFQHEDVQQVRRVKNADPLYQVVNAPILRYGGNHHVDANHIK